MLDSAKRDGAERSSEWTEVLGGERLTGALLDRLTALSETLARLRETQGRAAQALAARRAAEHLASEYQRRAQAASAAVSRAVSTASTRVPPSVVLPPPYRTTGGPASRGPSATR